MKRIHTSIGLHSLLPLFALLSCGDASRLPTKSLTQPIALGEHVVWLDQANEQALLLDVGARRPEPKVATYELPGRPLLSQRRHGSAELLTLLTDDEDDAGKLAVLDARGVERIYDVGTRFDTFTQSEDGSYVIVHYNEEGGFTEQTNLLVNPNEIAIIDLEREGEEAIVRRTLRSLSTAPRRFEFSPPMEIAGQTRRLLLVFFDAEVSLLDLRHLDRPEYTIELSRGSSISLGRVTFSPDDQKIYLLASGSNDVYVLRLLPSGANRENDYEPSLNQLGTDASPRDMAIFEAAAARRLLVASGQSAQVVEASSSRVTQIPLAYGADRILLYEGTTPFDDRVEQRALLYTLGNHALSFLDLEEVEERTTRNLEELLVSSSVSNLIPLGGNRVLLGHHSGGLSILDLEQRTATSIQARIPLGNAIPSLETGRIWVNLREGSAVGFIDLDNLHPGQVNLDRPVGNLFLMTETDPPRLVVDHGDPAGAVTILSAEDPSEGAVTLEGFFYEGMLD